MKKQLFIAICVAITFLLTSFSNHIQAQTLKVTAVDCSDQNRYSDLSKSLGKTITMTFYDNAVKLTLEGESKPMVLKKTSDTTYFLKEGYRNCNLSIDKTFGIISSITMRVTKTTDIKFWTSVTAKRF